mgnify:CR=1 FL=1
MKPIITISQCALQQLFRTVKSNLNKNNTDQGVLLYINSGGCNGFTYQFEPVYKQPDNTDKQLELITSKNIQLPIYICKKSQMYLLGTHIEWKQDIMGYRFEFNNPLAQSQCGCKTSFSTYH